MNHFKINCLQICNLCLQIHIAKILERLQVCKPLYMAFQFASE